MRERLKQILQAENLKSSEFAEILGVKKATITHLLNGRNNPSYDVLKKILEKFPHINPDWLIFGKGKMYRDDFLKNSKSENKQSDAEQQKLKQTQLNLNQNTQNNNQKSNTLNNQQAQSQQQPNFQQNSTFYQYQTTNQPTNQQSAFNFQNQHFQQQTQQSYQTPNQQFQPTLNLQLKNIPVQVIIFYPDNTFEIFTLRKKQ